MQFSFEPPTPTPLPRPRPLHTHILPPAAGSAPWTWRWRWARWRWWWRGPGSGWCTSCGWAGGWGSSRSSRAYSELLLGSWEKLGVGRGRAAVDWGVVGCDETDGEEKGGRGGGGWCSKSEAGGNRPGASYSRPAALEDWSHQSCFLLCVKDCVSEPHPPPPPQYISEC